MHTLKFIFTQRVKRESDRKEESFSKRIREQDELISILRQTLSSVSGAK
jgi:hypothetical protein